MLLSTYNSIEILIVVLVEGRFGPVGPNPEIHGFREATKGLSCPWDVWVTVRSQGRVLRAEAVILLLGISNKIGPDYMIITVRIA